MITIAATLLVCMHVGFMCVILGLKRLILIYKGIIYYNMKQQIHGNNKNKNHINYLIIK